jgi:hypothetical protein
MHESWVLSTSADIASIASLVITIIVFFQVRAIKDSVLLRMRIPEAIKDLERACEELRGSLKDWPQLEPQAKGATQRIDGILLNFLPKLSGAEKKKLNEARSLIRRRGSIQNKLFPQNEQERGDAMRNIYTALLGGIEALNQRNKDNKKRV